MQIVNLTIPRALKKLGYTQETIEAIVEYIADKGHVIDAPGPEDRALRGLRHRHGCARHLPDGSRADDGGDAAVPLRAISKTVNLPETATVEEIEDVYVQGWKLGLKALAVYRDNCKVGQPLSDGGSTARTRRPARLLRARARRPRPRSSKVVYRPTRERLPKRAPRRPRPSRSAAPGATSRPAPTTTVASVRSS